MDNKIKHLEFIQNVITRMNSNSFIIKGWTITIFSALLAFFVKCAEIKYLFVIFFPIFMFWWLDSFYLSQERKYRKLYDEICARNEQQIDFSMDASKFNDCFCSIKCASRSKTLEVFYGAQLLVLLMLIAANFLFTKIPLLCQNK
ncbi:MAG: hypothetical protein M0R20_06880 [Candidatus Omnitrophica bacterium]|jgi:hypothetical protein|nr:hypothetical protein [Candidatus Omnitrophota bacterium]